MRCEKDRRPGRTVLSTVLLLFFPLALPGLDRTLTDYSPFLPPPARTAPTPERKPETKNRITERLEFRGFFEMGGDWGFSIYDKQKRNSHWLSLGEMARSEDFQVTDFDASSKRVYLQWGSDRAFLDLRVAGQGPGPLRPRGGAHVAGMTFDDPPPPPPVSAPPAPPPPPASRPPSGPPPEIPPAVLAQYERMLEEDGRRPTGAILGGRSPSAPGPPPAITVSGLPPARAPGLPPGGGTGSAPGGGTGGGTGDSGSGSTRPGTGVEIPSLPGGVPGAPPTPPPNIVIPEIPDFPDD